MSAPASGFRHHRFPASLAFSFFIRYNVRICPVGKGDGGMLPEDSSHRRLAVGILAHVDAGKTTLSEAMLYLSGTLRKLGRVDHRDTFLDSHDIERERGITVFSKLARLRTDDMELTLLDTPGHTDFSGETERAISAMDHAILVISGTDGVQAHTETLWSLLRRRRIPTFLFVTKMDVPGTDRASLLRDMQIRLSDACLEITPENEEAIAMLDEQALEMYLSEGFLPDREAARLVSACSLFPVCFGSGLRLEGVSELLGLLETYAEEPPRPQLFGARVYKIMHDGSGGRITLLKITGGQLTVRSPIRYRSADGTLFEEKAAQLRLYSGARFEQVDTAPAGTVVGVTGLSATFPGQGLGEEPDAEDPVLIPSLSYRIMLPKGADARSIFPRLRRLEEEDPLLHLTWLPEAEEIRAECMGPLQTDVLTRLIRERLDLDVSIGRGSILYRETITKAAEGVGHFEPLRHYAEVHLLLEPGERGSGLQFRSAVDTDTLDLNWQRLILSCLEEKEHRGVLTGAPLTDTVITLIAGRAHLKHTEGGDFRQAASRAVRQGLMTAGSILLEPVYSFRLEVPAEQLGRAISDIHAMGGTHEAPETNGGLACLRGTAPVSAMREYPLEVAAYTRGRGRLSCRVEGYAPCRDAEAVIQQIGYDPEADIENTPDSVFCAHGAGFTVRWDEVRDHMHLDTGFGRSAGLEPEPRLLRNRLSIDDRELEAIMEREFGPIRRSQYTAPAPAVSSAAEISGPKKPEHIIVDGYNVIFAWDELRALSEKSLDLARSRLIDILISYRSITRSETVVVFDAYRVRGGQGEKYTDADLHIVFTRENETADMYIERLAGEIGKNASVRVVTSDSLVRLGTFRSGLLRTSSADFKAEVDQVLTQIAAAAEAGSPGKPRT